MKYLYLLLLAACMAFLPAHADTAYPHAQSKSQAEGQYLSAFWGKAQVSQTFIEVFYDATATLAVVDSGAGMGSVNVSGNDITVSANHRSVATVKVN
jgi:hypothetical protein